MLTLIDLGRHFGIESEEMAQGKGLIIIVEFNDIRCGILVDMVEVIHRLKWDEIEAPSPYLVGLDAPITGTTQVEDKTVLIADFETVVAEILGMEIVEESQSDTDGPDGPKTIEPKDVRILFADDSAILRTAVTRALKREGYLDLTVCTDGQQAWEAIEARQADDQATPFDLVLSDIEMPRMDGLHLTSKIKEDADLRATPVVLF